MDIAKEFLLEEEYSLINLKGKEVWKKTSLISKILLMIITFIFQILISIKLSINMKLQIIYNLQIKLKLFNKLLNIQNFKMSLYFK
jgi:hypothetical protein